MHIKEVYKDANLPTSDASNLCVLQRWLIVTTGVKNIWNKLSLRPSSNWHTIEVRHQIFVVLSCWQGHIWAFILILFIHLYNLTWMRDMLFDSPQRRTPDRSTLATWKRRHFSGKWVIVPVLFLTTFVHFYCVIVIWYDSNENEHLWFAWGHHGSIPAGAWCLRSCDDVGGRWFIWYPAKVSIFDTDRQITRRVTNDRKSGGCGNRQKLSRPAIFMNVKLNKKAGGLSCVSLKLLAMTKMFCFRTKMFCLQTEHLLKFYLW